MIGYLDPHLEASRCVASTVAVIPFWLSVNDFLAEIKKSAAQIVLLMT